LAGFGFLRLLLLALAAAAGGSAGGAAALGFELPEPSFF